MKICTNAVLWYLLTMRFWLCWYHSSVCLKKSSSSKPKNFLNVYFSNSIFKVRSTVLCCSLLPFELPVFKIVQLIMSMWSYTPLISMTWWCDYVFSLEVLYCEIVSPGIYFQRGRFLKNIRKQKTFKIHC